MSHVMGSWSCVISYWFTPGLISCIVFCRARTSLQSSTKTTQISYLLSDFVLQQSQGWVLALSFPHFYQKEAAINAVIQNYARSTLISVADALNKVLTNQTRDSCFITIKSYTQLVFRLKTVLQRVCSFHFTRIFGRTMMYWGQVLVFAVLTASSFVKSAGG